MNKKAKCIQRETKKTTRKCPLYNWSRLKVSISNPISYYVFQCRRRQQQKIYLCTQNIGNAMYCFHSSKFEMHALQR